MNICKPVRVRTLGLSVALGVLGSLAFAQASFADQPGGNGAPSGISCAVSDGRIAGNGSTLQGNMQNKVFGPGFVVNVCGPVTPDTTTPAAPTITSFTTPAGALALTSGSGMLAYNDALATSDNNRGSGAGLVSADCRDGNYWGTDIPYNSAELSMLNGTPGNGTADGVTCGNAPGGANPGVAGYTEPYNYEGVSTTTYPQAGGATAPVMTIPVAASAVTLVLNLTASGTGQTCSTGTTIGTPDFTPAQVSLIMSGDALHWNDSRLQGASGTQAATANAFLLNCSGVINRVVRLDDSGSTNAIKQEMVFYANTLTGTNTNCTGASSGTTWSNYLVSPNTTWPGSANGAQTANTLTNGPDGNCTPILHSASAGGGALITFLKGQPGGVGYADLADANGQGLILAQEQSQTGTFVSPKSGSKSNCNLSGVALPGSSFAGNVGLDTSDNWADDNSTSNPGQPNHSLQAITASGNGWPGCTLTYDLVYSGSNGSGTVNGSLQSSPEAYGTTAGTSVVTPDQARTMFSYFSYMLTSAAQNLLTLNFYQAIPFGDLSGLLTGFQQNY